MRQDVPVEEVLGCAVLEIEALKDVVRRLERAVLELAGRTAGLGAGELRELQAFDLLVQRLDGLGRILPLASEGSDRGGWVAADSLSDALPLAQQRTLFLQGSPAPDAAGRSHLELF